MASKIEVDTIYVVSQLPSLGDLLKVSLPGVNIKTFRLSEQFDWCRPLNPEIKEQIKEAEILFCDNTSIGQLMYDLPKLKWVQSVWAGVDSIFRCIDPKKPLPSFQLTRFGDNWFGDLMADYFLGQVISNERLFSKMWDDQKRKKWRKEVFINFRTVSDLTIGILGVGAIGSRVALGVKQRGATVYGLARRPRKDCELGPYDRIFTDMDEFLSDCDYVCSIVPSTPLTRGLLNGSVLKSCKKKPVFVSMGRGDVIDEDDLINALKQGWISKAILDVFKTEPLPENSILWDFPNVVITSHIGGITNASKATKCFLGNYKRYINNEELLYKVDWNQGY